MRRSGSSTSCKSRSPARGGRSGARTLEPILRFPQNYVAACADRSRNGARRMKSRPAVFCIFMPSNLALRHMAPLILPVPTNVYRCSTSFAPVAANLNMMRPVAAGEEFPADCGKQRPHGRRADVDALKMQNTRSVTSSAARVRERSERRANVILRDRDVLLRSLRPDRPQARMASGICSLWKTHSLMFLWGSVEGEEERNDPAIVIRQSGRAQLGKTNGSAIFEYCQTEHYTSAENQMCPSP